jgi:hypothetical protein
MFRSIFAFVALLAVAGAHAQAQNSVTVETATDISNQIFGVSFMPPGTTLPLNTDSVSEHRLESLALVSNTNPIRIDLLAADNGGLGIVDYVGNFTPGCTGAGCMPTFFCPPSNSNPPCTTGTVLTQAAAVRYPNGLSSDRFSNVFFVNNTPGKSPQPAVWVLPTNPAGGYPATAYQQAVPIDTTSPTGSLGTQQAVVETMVASTPLLIVPLMLTTAPSGSTYMGGTLTTPWRYSTGANYQVTLSTGQVITACTLTNTSTTVTCPSTNITGAPTTAINVPLANAGDLLVVSQSPDEILLYPGNGAGTGPLPPPGTLLTPTVLIPQCGPGACITAGSTPGGVAVWAADNSLLVTTFTGQILRFGIVGGVLTQMASVNGLPAGNLYKINTVLTGGLPAAYVALSAPGNHGSVLQLEPSGGGIQFETSVTTAGSVQAIAATNTAQGGEADCFAAGGCDLFLDVLNKHTVKTISGNPNPTHSNLVESICVVPQDPRGAACPGTPLVVNSVCPGFDNTNTSHPMIIPSYACGASGSSGTAFAVIKTVSAPDQFDRAYVQTEQKLDALFAGFNNPACPGGGGVNSQVMLWGPLADETLIREENVNIATGNGPNAMPTLVDNTDGCGSGQSGGPLHSIFVSGAALQLVGGNTTVNLQTFVAQKYPFLTNTIADLFGNGNITSATVAQKLTNPGSPPGPPGCIDASDSLFQKAVAETSNSPQYIPDMQDAADLLGNAGANTCDKIVTDNASAFVQTLAPPPGQVPIYNPTGQARWRFANIANGITMRILGLPPAGDWPTPVSTSVSPQYLFGQCNAPGCPPQQLPDTATLSWALANGTSQCSWGPNTPNQPNSPSPVGPFAAQVTPTTYAYTYTCQHVPPGSGPTPYSASTYVTVWAAVMVATSAQSVVAGGSVQVNWTPPTGATACTLTDNGSGTLSGTTSVPGPAPNPATTNVATYQTKQQDVAKGVTFAATCTAGASAGIHSITVTKH